MKRSQTVDKAIKRCWALLASEMFKKAKAKVEFDQPAVAERYVEITASWLEKAGAEATGWYFRT